MHCSQRSHRHPHLERLVLSGKAGQLSCLVSSFPSKPKYCELQHFHKKQEDLLVEQALLSVQAEDCATSKPLFSVQSLPGAKQIARVLLY